jgi:TorA maturation chaperone TorD
MKGLEGSPLGNSEEAAICALLARLFAGELDPALYRQLRSVGGDGLSWFEPALLALPEADAVEVLSVEYCRLFIGPQPSCPPYASAQLGAALLGGRPRTRLEAFLAQHGVPLPDEAWRVASLDHVAVELAVLAHLYATDASAAVIAEFLSDHLLSWAPGFLHRVEAASRHQLYRVAAGLAAALLEAAAHKPLDLPPKSAI